MFGKKKQLIKALERENEMLGKELDEYKARFRRAGSAEYDYFAAQQIKEYTAEIKGIPWGTWCALCEGADDDDVYTAKLRIAESIVMGLIERDLLQFIVKEPGQVDRDPLNTMMTVGAKVYVVPWEQMTTKTISVRKRESD